MPPDSPIDPVTWPILTILAGAVGSSVFLTWFIALQFSKIRSLIYRVISLHNKEDDDRFEALWNVIWKIIQRNAQKDGEQVPFEKPYPRRRYLPQDGTEDN